MRPSGATYADTTWQSKWWSRLGAREIIIPFDYAGVKKDRYNLLKVEELKGEFYHGAPYKDADIISNLRTAEPVPKIVYSRVSDVVLNAMALQYEPTLDLSLSGTPGYKFAPREGDTQGGVFGFVLFPHFY